MRVRYEERSMAYEVALKGTIDCSTRLRVMRPQILVIVVW